MPNPTLFSRTHPLSARHGLQSRLFARGPSATGQTGCARHRGSRSLAPRGDPKILGRSRTRPFCDFVAHDGIGLPRSMRRTTCNRWWWLGSSRVGSCWHPSHSPSFCAKKRSGIGKGPKRSIGRSTRSPARRLSRSLESSLSRYSEVPTKAYRIDFSASYFPWMSGVLMVLLHGGLVLGSLIVLRSRGSLGDKRLLYANRRPDVRVVDTFSFLE